MRELRIAANVIDAIMNLELIDLILKESAKNWSMNMMGLRYL